MFEICESVEKKQKRKRNDDDAFERRGAVGCCAAPRELKLEPKKLVYIIIMNKNIKSIALCILIIAFVLLLLLPCLYKESFSNATCISPDDLHLAYAAAQRSTRASHAAADRRARKNSRRMRANEGGEGESIKIRDNILTSLFLIQQCFSKSLEQIHGIGAASVVAVSYTHLTLPTKA